MRRYIKSAITATLALVVITSIYLPASSSAIDCSKSANATNPKCQYQTSPDKAAEASNCNGDKNCKKIFTYVDGAINLLSALVGIAAVAMIIFGGIEFSSSGGDPQRVASAKSHITNAIIALVAFLFLWAFLNFIIPGGLFNGQPPS